MSPEKLRHAGCVEHVRIAGHRVCVDRGADREAVIREARHLLGDPQASDAPVVVEGAAE